MTADVPAGEPHQDPMSSDKRVMIIGLVVMVALVGVGVVSASLFASSACDDIGPNALAGRVASTELGPVLDALGADADAAELTAFTEQFEERLGPLTGAADATGATAMTTLGGGVAAIGPTTVSLNGSGSQVVSAAEFAEPSLVVGSGERLYSLALINPLTGQVDALQPQDEDLDPGTCVDTAVVCDPFAFYLDAGGGELLLVRIEEDGDTPELELRDAFQGRRWFSDFEVPVAPPGVLGERITGALGEELIVAARRTVPGDEQAAVIGVERATGDHRWAVAAEDMVAEVAGVGDGAPIWVDVVALGDEVVVLAASGDQARDRAVLVVLDAQDGRVVSVIEPESGPAEVVDAALVDGELWVAWLDGEEADKIAAERYAVADGTRIRGERMPGNHAVIGEGIVATEVSVHQAAEDGFVEVAGVPEGVRVIDLIRVGDATSVLLELEDRGAAALTFAG